MWVAPGPEQGPKAGVPVSSEHSKLEPDSEEWNSKVGVGSLVVPVGPASIVVSGGVVSTVKERVAGLGSVLAAPSVARTRKV